MSLGFTKSFFEKQISDSAKKGNVIEDNFWGMTDNQSYAERLSDRGITFYQMHMMYVANVWARACVDKIVERVADIPPVVKPVAINDTEAGKLSDETKKNMERVSEFLITPNSNYESLDTIRKKTARDLLQYDASTLEILKGVDITEKQRIAEIFSVPGNTIKINADKRGILNESAAFIQVDSAMNKEASWKPDQMTYMMLNPRANRIYGFSPFETLVQTITAELYASQFNLDFFYNNATPRFAILMEGLGLGQGAPALTRVRKWWDQELQGKPHRPIIMGTEQGKVTLQKVGMSNEEMQFQEYSAYLLTKIMAVFKMQPIVLGIVGMSQAGSGGGATGNVEEQVRQFKLDAVNPQQKVFWERVNTRVIHHKDVLNIKDVYCDYDLDIVDKAKQAEWHDKYLQDGVITINEIRTRGLGLQPVPWGNVPYMQNNLAPFGLGPNGQAVPGDAAEAQRVAQQVVSGDGTPPEVATITASTSRGDLEKFLGKETEQPVGWENMDVSKRLEVVEQLIKEREKFLTKVWMIPDSKKLK